MSQQTGPLRERYGPYIIKEKIGAGGMATVYRARHINGSNDIALKVLAVHLAGHQDVRHRFEREARTLSQFNHPHILPVFDFGEDHDTPYIAMKLLSGQSLRQLLTGQPLPPVQIGQLTRQIASAMDYAHARGIIHRDIKPANILLDDKHAPYLADFGVAYLTESNPDARLTRAGAFVGTPAYASPEQCRGEQVGRSSDIYSLAILVFEMAAGRKPFEATSPLVLIKQHLHEPPPNPLAYNPKLPIQLYHVLARALAKLPENRFPSAMKFSEAIDEALGLHALPDQDDDADNWLYDDLAPVEVDDPVVPHTPATTSTQERKANEMPPFDVTLTYGADNPFAKTQIEDIAAAFDSDSFEVDLDADFADSEEAQLAASNGDDERFDDSFDLDFDDTSDDFADAVDLIPFDDGDPFPSIERVLNNTARYAYPTAPLYPPAATAKPPAAPTRPPLLAYGVILLSLVIIGGAVAASYTRLTKKTPETRVTYTNAAFNVIFDYPANWSIQHSDLAILSETPTGTITISDQPILPGSDYGAATLALALQRIDPYDVYAIPPACKPQITLGPAATFDCMTTQGYAIPVFEGFTTPRWTQGATLPGSLPPTRVSLPVIWLPTGEPTWIALIIIHWAGYPDARGMLVDVARSLR